MIAPCGLAWQVSRGVTEIPASCKAAIDAEYDSASPFAGKLSLPLKVAGLPASLSQFELYRILSPAPVCSTSPSPSLSLSPSLPPPPALHSEPAFQTPARMHCCCHAAANRNHTARTSISTRIKRGSISTRWSSSVSQS